MIFSVVIPLYNKALHIERAVNSVLAQTYQDFEIVVINDGSTDESRETVEGIHDTRINLIHQSNQGVSAARNRGVAAAVHEWIAFLDADDEWLPDFLETILTLMRQFPNCGAYATSARVIRPNGRVDTPKFAGLPPPPWAGIIPNFFETFQSGYAFNASSTVVSKQILLDVGGFPVGVKLSEDVVCWIQVAIRHPIAYSTAPLVVYHQEAANRSNVLKNLAEEPYIHIIRAAIQNGELPQELQAEALEFIAQRQIFTATANIMEGSPAYARQILASCRYTKKYKKLWLWWRFWAVFPIGLPSKFMQFKQAITRQAQD